MKVRLKVQVMLPFAMKNKYLNAGTILEVDEIRGAYYICSNEEVDCVFVNKDSCEVISNE